MQPPMQPPMRIVVRPVVRAVVILALAGLALSTSSGLTAAQLPLASTPNVLGDDIDRYERSMRSGGPPPDGIPSIDEPRFVPASDARLDPREPVIGFVWNGEARAYPQRIMVYHEIVNDRVGGLNVAVTYCPLTATAQAFRRGNSTLGVSGQLLNSNLVLFDRASGSFFSQIAATGLTGAHRGATLDELQAVWTTWERWQAAHPETLVLSERTGHLRNYRNDPYGSYVPPGGYYVQPGTLFPLLHSSSRLHPKAMVIGARTEEAAADFPMEALVRHRVLQVEGFLALYDARLDTGVIYRVPGDQAPAVTPEDDGGFMFEGRRLEAHELSLERLVAVEAFHFAWHAFYPESRTPQDRRSPSERVPVNRGNSGLSGVQPTRRAGG